MKEMAGIEVHNLRPIGKLNRDEAINVERCREVCYSDILCQFWQCPAGISGCLSRRYGHDGCRVQDPACDRRFET